MLACSMSCDSQTKSTELVLVLIVSVFELDELGALLISVTSAMSPQSSRLAQALAAANSSSS